MFDELKIKLEGLEILKSFMRRKLDESKFKCRLNRKTESLLFHESIQRQRKSRAIDEILRFDIYCPYMIPLLSANHFF